MAPMELYLMEFLQNRAPGISVESYSIPRRDLAREFSTGQLDFAASMTAASGALVFRSEVTTLPDGVTEAVKFEYIGRA